MPSRKAVNWKILLASVSGLNVIGLSVTGEHYNPYKGMRNINKKRLPFKYDATNIILAKGVIYAECIILLPPSSEQCGKDAGNQHTRFKER